MNTFNVIIEDFNNKKFIPYDIMPYLRKQYKEGNKKLKLKSEFEKFIRDESMYQFWGRCEYEIMVEAWPCKDHSEKIDVFDQIMMNIDVIAKLLMEDVK